MQGMKSCNQICEDMFSFFNRMKPRPPRMALHGALIKQTVSLAMHSPLLQDAFPTWQPLIIMATPWGNSPTLNTLAQASCS